MENFYQDITKQQLIADFKVVMADAEALLKATANQSGEKIAEVRAKVEESLKAVKANLADAQSALVDKTKATAQATDSYVHDHPWKVIGVAASVGVIVGLLIARRSATLVSRR